MKYFCLLTRQGEHRVAEATALGTKIAITQMAVGDGGGSLPTPDTQQTQLINERRRAAINQLWVDKNNPNQVIAEQIIPENEGGWWIREVGLFDKENVLIAVGNCPETYKPQLAEGSGRTQTIRAVFIVSHTEAVTLKIDPSVVLATRQYVDTEINKKIDKQAIKQTTGDSPTDVISQEGVTKALDTKQPIGDYVTQLAFNQELNNKIDKTKIVQTIGNSTEKVISQDAVTKALQNAMNINTLYPVGVVIWFAQNKNPNTLFPNTKWQYIGENKTIRLAKADGSNVFTSGGADAIKLTEAQLPAHGHTFSATTSSYDYGNKNTNTTGNHVHNYTKNSGYIGASGSAWVAASNQKVNATTSSSGNHSHTVAIGPHSHTVSGTTVKTGGGSEINITNAFVTLMGWYRIS
ncbi:MULTISPECIES: phage tail-collar fiber domain-containing protein [Arsenophonus]|uniref:phage tail-collar fiber domain-containing protein n=1 Tax=Arsenophonus TaxID=637 RepID=UPI0015D69A74|nr:MULTISPECIES: phage tail protein [Arsenophonus]UBX30088.1 phage tail protein [Arsenophonus apicola]